ncbi:MULTISPECIES: hypothetical protein [unclassified Novosphingobium]|uniref:hypothetical protein n=1 Tax=unclassified Novosphingobium TaxID=2644732 RepID=UPI00135AD273|nr:MULTISPECIES: hypothetical protein [unclassified Novosphingobium]
MRIRSTLAFSDAKTNHDRCCASWARRDEFVRDERFTAADVEGLKANLLANAESLIKTRALTGKDIAEKLTVMLEYPGSGFSWRALEKDIEAVDRPEPGPALRSAYAAFRTAWLAMGEHDTSDAYTDAEATRLSGHVHSTLQSVFRAPCTTAGDVLVKSYAHLLWHATHTNTRDIRGTGTGSFFDIDLAGIDSDSLLTDDYYRAAYDDLDHSDLGACLLSTGRIDFDARSWLDRAESIGMSVTLIVRDGEKQRISIGMIDSDDERLQREERRLQRLMAFDHAARWAAVSGFVTDHRPELLCHANTAKLVAAHV